MEHVFYFSTIVFLYKEMRWLYSPKEVEESNRSYKQMAAYHKGKSWDSYSDEYKSEIKSRIWDLFILLWLFVGIFTIQWPYFIAILLLNLIIVAPISMCLKHGFAYMVLHWINSFIGFGFGIFIILNKYYLGIEADTLFNLIFAK